MLLSSLERLVDTARALPGELRPVPPVRLSITRELDAGAVDARALRERLGRFLDELSKRLEPALTAALQHAEVAWDAFDEIAVLDEGLEGEAGALAEEAAALERDPELARRAVGTEVRIALESALGLLNLVERRLATLVRLRVQSGDRSLLPGGRPFLDVAAALAEAARGWR